MNIQSKVLKVTLQKGAKKNPHMSPSDGRDISEIHLTY